ncbi:MAG: hypothetical protein WC819_03095 [Parcubacteria group bacterium]|jgi:hypothetical protein
MNVSIETERKTGLTVSELRARLNVSPDHLHANELGVIFVQYGDTIAELTLINMLGEKNASVRFVAYCQLVRAHRLSQNAHDALKKFCSAKENFDLITEAKERFWLHVN